MDREGDEGTDPKPATPRKVAQLCVPHAELEYLHGQVEGAVSEETPITDGPKTPLHAHKP